MGRARSEGVKAGSVDFVVDVVTRCLAARAVGRESADDVRRRVRDRESIGVDVCMCVTVA